MFKIKAVFAALTASFLMLHATEPAAAKKVKFADKQYDLDTGAFDITFNGEANPSVACNLSDFTPEIVKNLALHGLGQKVGDSYAGVKGNVAEAIRSANEVIEQLKAGIWRAAPGEGESRPRLGELAEAISRIKGAPLDKAMAAVEAATDEQRKEWRSNSQVKTVIAQIRLEAAQKALEAETPQELKIELAA